jgi:ATP:ADP antiporter, AAA family
LISGTINRALNLRPGDLGRGAPFFVYYFLIIASYTMGQVAGDALFMERFKAIQLPYADIAIAVLVGFVVAIYLRASRRTNLKNLVSVCLLLFAAMSAAFWWSAHYSKWPWLFPVLYIWVGLFGVLATTQVWTLANFVWTTREAKRLFSLLGSGGILGGIFGGFFGSFAVKTFGTESLLLIISFFLVLCTVLVQGIGRQQRPRDPGDEAAGMDSARQSSLMQSFRVIRESGLLQTIAVLICVSSIVTTAAGWQLKAIAKESYVGKDALAAFLSSFRGYTGLLALAAQLFLTSRILKRFGVGTALFVLPGLLMVGSFGLLATGSLAAVTLLKGSDKVFRYSVDTSALQLLYLPIPSRVKLQAKSFIDTVVWRLGDGLAGFTVLLFASILHFTPQEIGLPNMGFLVVWFGVAIYARKQYVGTLSVNMQQLQLSPEQNAAPILDALATSVLADKLNSKDPSEVLYALDLFKMGEEHQSHEAVRNLLDHANPEIRTKAISVLDQVGDQNARTLVANLLKDKHLGVRTEALLYMSQYDHIDPLEQIEAGGDFEDYSVRSGIVAYLSRLGGDENLEGARVILDGMVREEGIQGRRTRLEAARLIANLPTRFEPQLGQLLQDADKEVVRSAMHAAASHHRRRWAPLLVERLSDPELHYDAVEALLVFGEAIAGTLRDYLGDESVPIEIRREIPPILLRLGTPVSVRILANNVIQGDNVLRYRIISALNKLLDVHKDFEMDADSIETVLVAEIMGYYRSCQLLESSTAEAVELRESMKQDLERIFRLLKLLWPEHALQDAYRGLQSKDPVMHANALEYLDTTLKPHLRNLLVPLIDSDVSNAERVQLADRLIGMKTNGDPAAPYFRRAGA